MMTGRQDRITRCQSEPSRSGTPIDLCKTRKNDRKCAPGTDDPVTIMRRISGKRPLPRHECRHVTPLRGASEQRQLQIPHN